ncbi:outer membrane protein [Sphingomonas montana]|uniref:outer membrane protein n=1 Tax=Sphingomonas montana TaxID=1843236 RepID=UPI00096F300C|nr:porin family protein [Sphingomonas montana]
MRSVAFAAILGSTMLVAAPAMAQVAAPFTGARVEGIVGYDNVKNGDTDDAVAYGVAAGYDMQMNGLVVGIEGEAADSDVRQCAGRETVVSPRLCAKAGRDLYAGARVGTVVGGRTLLYAKAGYTNAQFKLTSDDGTNQTTLGKTNLDGIRAGVGAEYAVGPNSYVKAEYRYSNYQDGFSRNQAVAGFGFRF